MSKNSSSPNSQTDWKRLEKLIDEEIDLSDIPELTAVDFENAKPLAERLAERGVIYQATDSHSVQVEHEDGTVKEIVVKSPTVVVLDPDVSKYFNSSKLVNDTLRKLIHLLPSE